MMSGYRFLRMIRGSLLAAILLVAAVFVLFPFFWMLSTSLKTEGRGMKFEFLPRRVAEVGPVEIDTAGVRVGEIQFDRTTVDETGVHPALRSAGADEVIFVAEEAKGKRVSGRLFPKDTEVWAAREALPAGNWKITYTVKRGWKAAFFNLYTFNNYRRLIRNKSFPFKTYLFNSFLVSVSAAILTVILCALAAYVFAKKEFPGKTVLFWSFMAAMMIPGMMYMVPQFAIVTQFGWINTLQGLVVPHLANVFGLFLLKQFMEAIPDSLLEAAEMDGATETTKFLKIITPLSMPSLAILFLLTFITQWNNFFWQLIVNTPDSPYITLPYGIALFRGQYETKYELMMAASSFSIVPIVILFLFTQRYLIEGLTAGGVKE
ncbi:MAG: carbohydrate ABC transporter permease [Candidatus Hydrogenedentota bacterium]|nr:MAG: carbohydrate ABC transporter permease [Candidatus Hydrogenedentota bacterium]